MQAIFLRKESSANKKGGFSATFLVFLQPL